MNVPPDIAALNERPGAEWTEADLQRWKRWWIEPEQLRLLWQYAARYLGAGVNSEDIEDATVAFFPLFEETYPRYQPGETNFCSYMLHVCFKRHCVRAGKQIRQRLCEEISLDPEPESESRFELELKDAETLYDPLQQARYRAFQAEIASVLNDRRFPRRQKQAFVLRFFEERTYEEIAAEMNAPIGSVKGWLSRARGTVRALLEERGWTE